MISIRSGDGGVIIPVRVSPGASRTAPGGEHDGRWRIYAQAPPDAGRANQAVLRVVSQALGLGSSGARLVSGTTGRNKSVCISGLEIDIVLRRMRKLGLQVEIKR